MPLQDELLIAVKDGVVEMTATLVEAHRDDPEDLIDALQHRLADHQYQAMTDDAIMGDGLGLASCLLSRDPIPAPLQAALATCGFTPTETPGGGRARQSFFTRFTRTKTRSQLEKWQVLYTQSDDIDPALSAFESMMVDDLPSGSLAETAEHGAALVMAGARSCLGLAIRPDLNGLSQLEMQLDRQRRRRPSRWIMRPPAVRALAQFVARCFATEAPGSRWSRPIDEDNPLWVQATGGFRIETDPEYRVVEFVRRGLRASLADYVKDVIGQSEN
ncbi:MAG: hypothetical protein AAFV29_06725, partial [Myxococcota bacterium]